MVEELLINVVRQLEGVNLTHDSTLLPEKLLYNMEEGLLKNPPYIHKCDSGYQRILLANHILKGKAFGTYNKRSLKVGTTTFHLALKDGFNPLEGVAIIYSGHPDIINAVNRGERIRDGAGAVVLLENGAISSVAISPKFCIPLINSWYPPDKKEFGVFPYPSCREDVEKWYDDLNKFVPDDNHGCVYKAMPDLVMICATAWRLSIH